MRRESSVTPDGRWAGRINLKYAGRSSSWQKHQNRLFSRHFIPATLFHAIHLMQSTRSSAMNCNSRCLKKSMFNNNRVISKRRLLWDTLYMQKRSTQNSLNLLFLQRPYLIFPLTTFTICNVSMNQSNFKNLTASCYIASCL